MPKPMGTTRQLVPLTEVPNHRPWASERYLRYLVEHRRIPYHKLNEGRAGRVLIDLDDLDRFAEAGRIEAVS